MMRTKILTIAGVIQLATATLLSLMFLFGQPITVSGSMLGLTPTPIPLPTTTPVPPPPPPTPHLTITKSASSDQALPGDQIVFTIQVCNEGDATADNVVVSDALPSELEMVSASASQGTVVVEGNGMRAELGALLPGACASVTIVARVRADVAPGTQIRNVASVDGTYDDTTVTVVGLLPETGSSASLVVVVGQLAVGMGLLIVELVLRARSRA